MKVIVLALLVAIATYSQSQPPSPTPPKASQDQKTNGTSESHSPAKNHQPPAIGTPVINSVKTEDHKKETSDVSKKRQDEPSYDWWVPTWVALGALGAIGQAIAVAYQARLMRAAMKITMASVRVSKRAADAARESARAALAGVEDAKHALIVTERAYVQITYVSIEDFAPNRRPIITCRMVNTGRTLARISELNVVLGVSTKLPDTPNYWNIVTPPAVLMAGEILDWAIRCDYDVTPEKLKGVHDGSLRLYIYGLTIYKDALGKSDRRTGFGRRYDPRQSKQRGFPVFTYCEAPGYNYAD